MKPTLSAIQISLSLHSGLVSASAFGMCLLNKICIIYYSYPEVRIGNFPLPFGKESTEPQH